PRQVRYSVVNPECVGIQHIERFRAEFRQGLHDAPRGVEQAVAFIRNYGAWSLAAGKVGDDLPAKVVNVDDGYPDADFGQRVQPPIETLLAGTEYQRLRRRVGQRAHALAKPGREHHRSPWNLVTGTHGIRSCNMPCSS